MNGEIPNWPQTRKWNGVKWKPMPYTNPDFAGIHNLIQADVARGANPWTVTQIAIMAVNASGWLTGTGNHIKDPAGLEPRRIHGFTITEPEIQPRGGKVYAIEFQYSGGITRDIKKETIFILQPVLAKSNRWCNLELE